MIKITHLKWHRGYKRLTKEEEKDVVRYIKRTLASCGLAGYTIKVE